VGQPLFGGGVNAADVKGALFCAYAHNGANAAASNAPTAAARGALGAIAVIVRIIVSSPS
jgi:hypothetical protein